MMNTKWSILFSPVGILLAVVEIWAGLGEVVQTVSASGSAIAATASSAIAGPRILILKFILPAPNAAIYIAPMTKVNFFNYRERKVEKL